MHTSKFHGAFASTSTPSTRRLLDGVTLPVPRRSTDAPDSLVDFHTGDYELDANAEATHPRPNGMSTLFVYVYEGAGTFCGMFQCPWYAIDATARENLPAIEQDARAQGPQRKGARCSACRVRAT